MFKKYQAATLPTAAFARGRAAEYKHPSLADPCRTTNTKVGHKCWAKFLRFEDSNLSS